VSSAFLWREKSGLSFSHAVTRQEPKVVHGPTNGTTSIRTKIFKDEASAEIVTAVVSNGTPVTMLSAAMAKQLGFELLDKTEQIEADLKACGNTCKYDYVVSGLKIAPENSKFKCEIKWALVVNGFSGTCQLGADFMREGDIEMFVLFNFVGMLFITASSASPYDKPHDGREFLRIAKTSEELEFIRIVPEKDSLGRNKCHGCEKLAANAMTCPVCKAAGVMVYYCGKECQLSHWPEHKKTLPHKADRDKKKAEKKAACEST
jgi:hypothetical protein